MSTTTVFGGTTTGGPCEEQFDSRMLEITTDGDRGERVWYCDQPIWNPNSPVDLYDSWPTGHASMKVRSIRFERYSKVGSMVTAKYATEKNSSVTVQEWGVGAVEKNEAYDLNGDPIQAEGGATVYTPQEIFGVKQYLAAFPAAQVLALVGKRNDAAWGIYPKYTWLFMGGQGLRSGLGAWETTYNFQYDPNGWWIRSDNDVLQVTVTQPVYEDGDFTTLPGLIPPT